MRGLLLSSGPLCRGLVVPVPRTHVFKRYKFGGRPKTESSAKALPPTPARTRFAPSPTGYLHIGSLRTALYNYLLAKATGGQFLLRVEDTDQTRIVRDAEQRLYDDLGWAGLEWDEGPTNGGPFGPYKQSERLETYRKYADQLLEDGRAYRCFCSPEELDKIKQLSPADGGSMFYTGACSHISKEESDGRAAKGEQHCVRFRCDHAPAVQDIVYGFYKRKRGEDNHFIIVKRDGFPTYHFANVVDDHLMEITHVVRGEEWLVSTPKHVALYEAFGWKSPAFAHVGLLVDMNGQKLSKRHGNIDITAYQNKGILPSALLNWVMLLGWSPGKSTKGANEVMDLAEMVEKFSLKFTKGNCTVNDKIDFLQKSHKSRLIRSLPEAEFTEQFVEPISQVLLELDANRTSQNPVKPEFKMIGDFCAGLEPGNNFYSPVQNRVKDVLELPDNLHVESAEFLERNLYLLWTIPTEVYRETLNQDMESVSRLMWRDTGADEDRPITVVEALDKLSSTLSGLASEKWATNELDASIKSFVQSLRAEKESGSPVNWGWHLLRWVLVAGRSGPGLAPSMKLLGKEHVMQRVASAQGVAAQWQK